MDILMCKSTVTMYSGPDRFRLPFHPDIGVAFGNLRAGVRMPPILSPRCQRDRKQNSVLLYSTLCSPLKDAGIISDLFRLGECSLGSTGSPPVPNTGLNKVHWALHCPLRAVFFLHLYSLTGWTHSRVGLTSVDSKALLNTRRFCDNKFY